MHRALFLAPLLFTFACKEPEVSGAADRSAKVSPLEKTSNTAAAAPGSQPAAAPASAPAAAPTAPTAPPPPAPKKAAPSLFTCVKFPDGLTVIGSDQDMAKLGREPLPMSEGCPDQLPPSGINYSTLNLVLAQVNATCNGQIRETAEGFEWSEWGDCERAQVLKASKLVGKAEAKSQKLTKVDPPANPPATP